MQREKREVGSKGGNYGVGGVEAATPERAGGNGGKRNGGRISIDGGTETGTTGLRPGHPFSRFSAISLKAAAERTRTEGRRTLGDLHRKVRKG